MANSPVLLTDLKAGHCTSAVEVCLLRFWEEARYGKRQANGDDDWTNHYPPEYLNSLEFSGLPNHRLCLKVGAPMMLLRNLNQDKSLCSGTRMVVTLLGNRIVKAKIMAGTDIGEEVLIPRIQLIPTTPSIPSLSVDDNSRSDCATP
uniref:ATP-dependent DNA helicase n=1 Tax=Brassica oleracea var. oleracea TaxID=109376 RepID=A0A0D3DSZ6_BRAOL